MQNFELFSEEYWYPLSAIGLTTDFWRVNVHTIINTWLVLLLLTTLILIVRYGLSRNNTIIKQLSFSFVETFKELYFQTLSTYSYEYFTFCVSLFIFILLCNMTALIPFAEEPTGDLNTTVSLAIISFVYTQIASVKALGIKKYLHHFIEPISFLLPLNIIEKLSSVLSLSLRLFGNIFGGMLLTKLYLSAVGGVILYEFLGMALGINLLIMGFFGIFEGFIQAFVFTVLTLTYLSFAVQTDEDHA